MIYPHGVDGPMADDITRDELVTERFLRNGIGGGFPDPVDCAESLFGIQFQVRSFAEIALYNRVQRLTMKRLEHSYSDGSLISKWGQRRTYHLYSRNDSDAVCDIFHDRNHLDLYAKDDPTLTVRVGEAFRREIEENGAPDVGRIREMCQHLLPDDLLRESYHPYAVYSWLCNNGYLYGSMAGGNRFSVDTGGWECDDGRTEASIQDMMLRYFRFFGPASRRDFCHYSGLGMKETDEVFSNIKDQLDVRTFNGQDVYSLGPVPDRSVRGITVLGKYDPLMLSYSDKTWICDERRIPIIWTRAARVQAVIVRRNRIIGFWQQRQKDSVYEVSLFRDIAEKDEESISKRLERISGFLGKTYKGTEFSVVR